MAPRTGWFARAGKPSAAPIRVLTAAATRLNLEDRKQAQRQRVMRQGWQSDAWAYRDAIGELRYAINFLANCTARMKLYPAAYPAGGEADSPLPLSEIADVPANVTAACEAAMRDLGNGRLAISGLLHALSTNTSVAGECFLVGEQDPKTGRETWNVRSIDEIVIENDEYRLRELPNASAASGGDGWRKLDPALSVVSRIWTPHPRYQLLADSPCRAIMDDCESLLILRRMIRATGRSRLAGRGILLIPDELSIKAPDDDNADPESDPIMRELTETMMEPIGDEGVASAVVPIVIRGPGETLAKVQHIDFASQFDEQSSKTRDELVGIIATGLDIPKEVISGMSDLNHWTAWQVDDNTFRHHVEPHVIGCCDAVTGAYLRPYLEANGVDAEWVQRCLFWYDPVELVTHPDQTKDALELHDRLVISDEALRKIAGFPDEDTPSKAEIQVRLLEKMRMWPPNLVMAFLHAWDPTLVAPAIETAGTIPGIGPGGVDLGTPQGGASAPAPMLEAGPAAPPPAPAPRTDGPPPITAAGTGQQTGVMVALFPDPGTAANLALPDGDPPEDLHVTLAYLGSEDELADTDPEAIHKTVEAWALGTPAITGEISGVGLFTAGPDPVTYLSVDLPSLPAARETLIAALGTAATATPSDAHGFTPHMTLQYADRVNDVPAIGGTPLSFATVAVVIGTDRTDYPFAESLVAAGARSRAEKARLSRKLTAIDADLRGRLHTAANAAMLRQLERAGARLRTKVNKDETLRTKIAQRPNELVPGLVGEAVVASIGVTADDLMGSDWSGLRAQFMEWTAAAQTQAIATAIRLGSLTEESDAVIKARAALDAGRDAAWDVLTSALTGLGHHLLYSPHPNTDPAEWADLNAETLVPTGTVRAALAVAGGASLTDVETDAEGVLTFLPGTPIGQIGTGATITDLLTTAGLATTGYSWQHGPALRPFEPHEALDGVDFENFDDDVLANNDDWPDNSFFMPGDHDGCSCDFVALWVDGGAA